MNTCFKNNLGIPFAISQIAGQIFYICKICEKPYLTKKSAMEHKCDESFQPNQLDCKNVENNITIKYLLIWLAKKNIPFHAIYDIDFHGFLKHVKKEFQLPSETSLRKYIHTFSNYILKRIYEEIFHRPVSLMIDGAKREGQKYQGLILYTTNQLYFIGLSPCQNEKSETIAKIVSDTAEIIKNNKSRLVSVCSDNASFNKSAMDSRKTFSAQRLSNENFIWWPCSCHTLNLAVKDVFTGNFKQVFDIVIQLIIVLDDISQTHKIGEVPRFREVRWYSFTHCVNFICSHYKFLNNQQSIENFSFIEQNFKWKYISSILNSIEYLFKKLENDSSSIADLYKNITNTLHELKNINSINPKNDTFNIAKAIYNSITNRFTKEMDIPCFAYLLTGPGLRNLNENNIEVQNLIIYSKNGCKNYVSNDFYSQKICHFFDIFLNYHEFSPLFKINSIKESIIFWYRVQNDEETLFYPKVYEDHPEIREIEKKFSKIAIQILSIPCSEAACERVFSHLSDILMNNKRNLPYDTLNALMIIRINSLFMRQNGKHSNDFIRNDIESLCKIDYDIIDAQNEEDPLVLF